MNKSLSLLVPAACLWIASVPGRLAAADISGEYRIVQSSRPDGGGGYGGKINITSQGPSFLFQWTLDSGDSYTGPAIMLNGVVGAGYGEGLSGLAVYAVKGKTLKARWLLPATPKVVGDYELSGPASLNGSYKFTNGLAGGVTIKPNGKVFDISWTLPTGTVTGVGIRVGDVLVAVSGTPGSNFGVAAYRAAKERIEGVWTVPGQTGLGTENIVPASAAAASTTPASKGDGASFQTAGADVQFLGETYHLQDSVSAPGQPTSEVREYLRSGESFEDYPKMVALRIQNPGNADPLTFTRGILKQTKKDYPDASTNEIEHSADSSTMAFVIKSDPVIEFNFWHCFRTPRGMASVQFVMRNKGPFDTEDKLKAEAVEHINDMIRDAKALSPQVIAAIDKTAKSNKGAAVEPSNASKASQPAPAAADENEDLAAKIAADFRVAGGIAGNFLDLLKTDKFNDAAALVADEGFTRMHTSKADFLSKLQQIRRSEGRMLSYAPDKGKPDFGAEEGGVYFVLSADSKFEKSTARETLRFFRFPGGNIKLIGYQHASKVAGQ